MVEVQINDSKTSLDAVHKAIATAGHDTKKYKAKDEVYNDLPGCCKYDRADEKKKIRMKDILTNLPEIYLFRNLAVISPALIK